MHRYAGAVACLLVLGGMHATSADAPKNERPVKLAVVDVGTAQRVPPTFLDFLSVSLSGQSGLVVLEREQVNKLLREQALNLSLGNPVNRADAVQAGKLWAVDTFLMLEASKDAKGGVLLHIRLVDARHGMRLWDSLMLLSMDQASYRDQAELLGKSAAMKAAVASGTGAAHVLAVSTFRSEEVSKSWDWLSESLASGLEQHLGLVRGVLLLERTKTGPLTDERSLVAGLPEALKASAVLVSGSFRLDRAKGLDAVVVLVECRRGGKVIVSQRIEGSLKDPGPLCRRIALVIAGGIGKEGAAGAMPAEAEARLLATQARAFMTGNYWANDPERALAPAEAALALVPDSAEYSYLVLQILGRRLAEWAFDPKQTAAHWGDALVYCRRAIPLAERVAAAQGKTADWPVVYTVEHLFQSYFLLIAYQGRHKLAVDAQTEETLRDLRASLRALHARAMQTPGWAVSFHWDAAVYGSAWCETPRESFALARRSLEGGVAHLKTNSRSIHGSVIQNGLAFETVCGNPAWSAQPDLHRSYLAFLDEMGSHKEPLVRVAVELAATRYFGRTVKEYGKARKHCERFLRLLEIDLAPELRHLSFAVNSWVYLSLANSRFDADGAKDLQIGTEFYRRLLTLVLEHPQADGAVREWKDCLTDYSSRMARQGQAAAAVAFLQEHLTRLEAAAPKRADDAAALAALLAQVQQRTAQPVVHDPALRAVRRFHVADHLTLFPNQDGGRGRVELRRLVLDDGVLALVCTSGVGDKDRFGLVRLDPATFAVRSFATMPGAAAIKDKGSAIGFARYGPAVALAGEDVYVSAPGAGIVSFPKDGPPTHWTEKGGLASDDVGALAFLDGKLYAVMGTSRTEAGLMAVDPRTGVAEVTFSGRAAAAPNSLDGRRIVEVLADPKRHRLWIGIGVDYQRPNTGSLYAYYPADKKLVKKLLSDQGLESMRWNGDRIVLTSFHVAALLDPETDKISGLIERQGGFGLPGLPAPRRMKGEFWCSPHMVLAGQDVIYQDRNPYKSTLLSMRAGAAKPVSILEACFPPTKGEQITIVDLAMTAQGLLVLTRDSLYVVPWLAPKKPAETPKVKDNDLRHAFEKAYQQLVLLEGAHPVLKGLSQAKPVIEQDGQGLKRAYLTFERNTRSQGKPPPPPKDAAQPHVYLAVSLWTGEPSQQPPPGILHLRVQGMDYFLIVMVGGSDPDLSKKIHAIVLDAFNAWTGPGLAPRLPGQGAAQPLLSGPPILSVANPSVEQQGK